MEPQSGDINLTSSITKKTYPTHKPECTSRKRNVDNNSVPSKNVRRPERTKCSQQPPRAADHTTKPFPLT